MIVSKGTRVSFHSCWLHLARIESWIILNLKNSSIIVKKEKT
jgi:hypothetical protein